VRRALAVLAAVIAGLALLRAGLLAVEAGLPDVRDLARHAPHVTALMRQRRAQAARQGRRYRPDQRWVPYERVSPLLRRAVLIAEDDAFYSHGGLDWNEIRASARKNLERGRVVRGGSTITQQLAKNLYLGDERTLTRKLKEVLLAVRLERALGKRRIFELYLNLIEWGDGIYGIEAAAERYFGVPAAALDARQAVRLAAVIINPRRYSPTRPAARIERRARIIASRMLRRGYLSPEQYREAVGAAPPPGLFESLFGLRPDTLPPARPPLPPSVAAESAGTAPDSLARAEGAPPGR
jgi:monofunctional biosynthetic peptidoglycan transglycosylase